MCECHEGSDEMNEMNGVSASVNVRMVRRGGETFEFVSRCAFGGRSEMRVLVSCVCVCTQCSQTKHS